MTNKKNGMNYARYGYFFSIPFIAAFLIFSLYPTIYTAFLGFTDAKGLTQTTYNVLKGGEIFKNYDTVLHNPSFITSLKNTISIWIMNFIPQITMALLLTSWFTSHSVELKGKGFFKVVFYMPNIITAASVAILFNALFSYPVGPVNDFLTTLKFVDGPVNFSISKTAARVIVAFIQFWTWYGNTMIVLISGVLGISPDIFEAADIDGANGVQTFFLITIPNLKTVLLYTLVTSLVGGLNMYDIPQLFLGGGPDNATLTTSVFIYNQAFSGSYMYARASAASMIMWIIIVLCSAVLFFIMRDKDEIAKEKERKAAIKKAKMLAKEGK